MNVIRHPKRGGGNPSGGSRPFTVGVQKPRGRGRGVLDFDLIQYRPGQRACTTSSSSSNMKTPSNLELQMAISSSAHRTASSSSGNKISSPSVNAFGQSLRGNHTRSYVSSSGASIPTPRYSALRPPKTPRNNLFTPKNSMLVSNTPRTTPNSSSTGGDHEKSHVVLAVTEGRGYARGEVGIAVIDMKRPRLILCQLSDRQTYVDTLTKVCVFQPTEILVPHTFVDSNQPNKLYKLLEEKFPFVSMTKVQRRLFRDSEGLEKVQYLCLPESSSCQLILQDRFYALAAAAALLKYVEFVQNVIFASHSLKVEYQGAHHGTIIDVKTAKNLELLLNQQSNNATHTLVSIMDHCSTHGGSRLLRASLLHPPCSLPTISRRQDGVQELVENPSIAQKVREVLNQLPDVEQLLTLCMLTPSTIDNNKAMETRVNYVLMLKTTMETLPHLSSALDKVHSFPLSKAKETLKDPRCDLIKDRLLQTLNEDVKAPRGGKTASFQRCFAIKSGVNDLMDVARKTYCELISDMHDHVVDIGNTHALPVKMNYSLTKGYHIQIPIQRNNPIKKSNLPPILVQAQESKNNLTCTTEILIHANERIKGVTAEIMNMSNTLLTVVLNDVRSHISYLYGMCESIAEIDLILSLAQISCSHNYVRPKFGDCLSLKASRHPILESITTCDPIANDIEASSWKNLSIITGPNMSGKSIYIRQILLLQIMAQVGCYVPAEEATFRITDRIFSHLNFDDSIENNASTLSLEMREMQLILSSITGTSLVAIDELCRGTSVEEGTALAWAICEELSQSSAFVFVTTHFKELTKLACLYPCVKNIHLETVEQEFSDKKKRLVYTHRLLPGINPVEGYGLRLAESLEVPGDILAEAYSFASQITNASEACFVSAQGDESYILAKYFLKLKFLAEKDDLSPEDLQEVKLELQEELKLAETQKDAIEIDQFEETIETNQFNFSGNPQTKTRNTSLLQKELPRNSDIKATYRSEHQKLCPYSSSDHESTECSEWSDSFSKERRKNSICSKDSSFKIDSPQTQEEESVSESETKSDLISMGMGQRRKGNLDDTFHGSQKGCLSERSLSDSPMSVVSCFSHDTWLAESPKREAQTSKVIEGYSRFNDTDSLLDYENMSPSFSRSPSKASVTPCHTSDLISNPSKQHSEAVCEESFYSLDVTQTPSQISLSTGRDVDSKLLIQNHDSIHEQSPFNTYSKIPSKMEEGLCDAFQNRIDDTSSKATLVRPQKFNMDANLRGIKRLHDNEDENECSPILGSVVKRSVQKKSLPLVAYCDARTVPLNEYTENSSPHTKGEERPSKAMLAMPQKFYLGANLSCTKRLCDIEDESESSPILGLKEKQPLRENRLQLDAYCTRKTALLTEYTSANSSPSLRRERSQSPKEWQTFRKPIALECIQRPLSQSDTGLHKKLVFENSQLRTEKWENRTDLGVHINKAPSSSLQIIMESYNYSGSDSD